MREKIIDCFNEYIRGFDNSDPMIILKKEHTYRVANLSEKIARSISDIYDLSEGDVDLAWIIGMFHDIGRFEQFKRYGTFRDADSIDHAQFGADILFDSNRDARLRLVLPESEIIEIAIRNHNKYRLPMAPIFLPISFTTHSFTASHLPTMPSSSSGLMFSPLSRMMRFFLRPVRK